MTSVASKGMSGGAATSVWGAMTSNETIALIGVTITILGFVVNLIFQFRRDRREEALQNAKLAALAHGQEET